MQHVWCVTASLRFLSPCQSKGEQQPVPRVLDFLDHLEDPVWSRKTSTLQLNCTCLSDKHVAQSRCWMMFYFQQDNYLVTWCQDQFFSKTSCIGWSIVLLKLTVHQHNTQPTCGNSLLIQYCLPDSQSDSSWKLLVVLSRYCQMVKE